MTRPELFSGIINLAASQWLLPANCISKIALPTAASPPPLPRFLWDCHLFTHGTPLHNLPIICSLWCGRLPERLQSAPRGCISLLCVRQSTESLITPSTVCVKAAIFVPSACGGFLIIHIPSPFKGCISTKPSCSFPVASILFTLSVHMEDCAVFIGVYLTVLPSQRPGFLWVWVSQWMVTWSVFLYYTGERGRGPYLSVAAGTEVLLLVGTLWPHIVLGTFPLCVNTP